MSVAEIKQQVETLSLDERLELSVYLKHIARRDDPTHQRDLERIMNEMDQGIKFTMQDVEKLHAARSSHS